MNETRKWLRSFRYAYEGIGYALRSQRNMKFHFLASFAVLIAALILGLTKLEVLFLLLAMTLVIVTELINTAIEKTVDLAMPEIHPLAKIAKDVAAASVLVTAVFAVAVGMIVFYDPIDRFLNGTGESAPIMTAGMIWLLLALILISVIIVETRFSKPTLNDIRPSMWAAVAFALSTLITLMVHQTIVFLLSYTLSFILILVLYEKKSRSALSLVVGGLIGISITLMFYLL